MDPDSEDIWGSYSEGDVDEGAVEAEVEKFVCSQQGTFGDISLKGKTLYLEKSNYLLLYCDDISINLLFLWN